MAEDLKTNPPRWAKDAVPSEKGWHDRKTGELLIAVKGIDVGMNKWRNFSIRRNKN